MLVFPFHCVEDFKNYRQGHSASVLQGGKLSCEHLCEECYLGLQAPVMTGYKASEELH